MKYILEIPYDFSQEVVEEAIRKAFNKRVEMIVKVTKVDGKITIPRSLLEEACIQDIG